MHMKYYHVSSRLKEGNQLLRTGKVGYDFCVYGTVCDLSTYEEYIECYRKLCLEQIYSKTKRTAGKWITEYLFEKVRREKYSFLPSRLWSIFLSDSFEESKNFLETERAYEGSKIFEIETTIGSFPLIPSSETKAAPSATNKWELSGKII